MAELARDIISISEQDTGYPDPAGPDAAPAPEVVVGYDVTRQASFDMVLGPAPKSSRLRRSKNQIPEDAAEARRPRL